ncbi:DsbA family protein [Blastococcus sp. SYSU D00695]
MPADRDRREVARRRIEEKRAAEAARAAALRRRRTLLGAVVAAVVLVVAVVVVIAVQSGRTATSADAPVPAGTSEQGTAVAVGTAGAPVVVDVYEDFQCPHCATLEEQVGPTLRQLADAGTVLLRYRPMAFLDEASTTDYSTRALNAAGAVLDAAGPDAFGTFHDRLFAEQPAEGGAGLSDDRLVDLAAQAGATGPDVADAIRDRRYGDWTARVTDAASRAGITGTPTVLVDGDRLDPGQLTADGVTAAVQAAAA